MIVVERDYSSLNKVTPLLTQASKQIRDYLELKRSDYKSCIGFSLESHLGDLVRLLDAAPEALDVLRDLLAFS